MLELHPDYSRNMNENFLLLPLAADLDTDNYPTRMLLNGNVPGLLRCRLQNLDGEKTALYEITSMQSLASIFENRRIGYSDLHLVLRNLVEILETFTEYLLNPSMLVLLPEFLYSDAGRSRLYFCFLPGLNADIREQLRHLAEYLLPLLDHQDHEAVVLGYAVYRHALSDSFSLEAVKEELFRQKTVSPLPCRPPADDPFQKAREPFTAEDLPFSNREARPDSPEKERDLWETPTTDPDVRPIVFPSAKQDFPTGIPPSGADLPSKKKKGLSLLLPTVGAAGLLLALAGAKMAGFLPEIPILSILAASIACLCVCVLLSRRKKRGQKKERSGTSASEEAASFPLSSHEPGDRALAAPFSIDGSAPPFRQAASPFMQASSPTQSPAPAPPPADHPLAEKPPEAGADKPRFRVFHTADQEDDCGETITLSSALKKKTPCLASREPGELATIYLTEELTIIGKMEKAADVVIPLPTVSRIHAKIRRKEDGYYLLDLNSRNGTSVNGTLLKAEEEYLLQDQDEVDFAQARYVYLSAG